MRVWVPYELSLQLTFGASVLCASVSKRNLIQNGDQNCERRYCDTIFIHNQIQVRISAIETGALLLKVSIGFDGFLGDCFMGRDTDYSLSSDWFPSLLCLSGSGHAILKVCANYSQTKFFQDLRKGRSSWIFQ